MTWDSNFAIDYYDCWIWLGPLGAGGYASMCEPQEGTYPIKHVGHRYMYEKLIGPIPGGHILHHTCEVKRCVNPQHLVPTTPEDHMRFHSTEYWDKRRKKKASREQKKANV